MKAPIQIPAHTGVQPSPPNPLTWFLGQLVILNYHFEVNVSVCDSAIRWQPIQDVPCFHPEVAGIEPYNIKMVQD